MLESLDSPWIFGSITVIIIGLCFIAIKVGSIVVDKNGLSIGKSKTKKSPHASCPHSKDIMDLVHRTADHYEKIQNLKNSIIKEQMRYYEEIAEETIGKIKHNFTKLLVAKLDDNEQFINHDDYIYFSLLIKVIFSELKSYVRNCFSSNHYNTYTIELQQDYIDKKTVVILQKAVDSLNDCWRGSLITRTSLYEDYKLNIDFFEQQIQAVFNRAFLITRDIYSQIEVKEKQYNDYIIEVVGKEE